MKTDIIDKGDRYLVQAELPGFNKEEIHIDIKDNYLTVHAEHREEKEEKKENYIRKERRYGSYERSFDISDVNADQIEAKYNDGVLELQMPKLPKNRLYQSQFKSNEKKNACPFSGQAFLYLLGKKIDEKDR